jgi:Holliday junction resolvase-like predicted endonuclease
MKSGYLNPIYKLSTIDPDTVPRKISYSQWSMYERCPKSYELAYIKRLAPFTHSIETCFGTAFHETMQDYLTTLYTKSVKAADNMNLPELLLSNMHAEYKACLESNEGAHFSNPTELSEYHQDGVAILDWFKKRRGQYFSSKGMELIGIELQLCTPASSVNKSVYWYGFVDIVMRDTKDNMIKIIDIKTSRNGWNKYQKADKLKAAQLIAYKNYYSQQYGVPKDNIEVEFFVVKRKMQEDSMFPQKRIQEIVPSSGKITQKQVQSHIDKFIETAFDAEGNRREDVPYMAIAGKGAKHCKWCPFKEDYENCPKENRIRE